MNAKMKNSKEFNGYGFRDKKIRTQMKYIVILDGDLDLNGAYGFRNKKELDQYLSDHNDYYSRSEKIQAIFSVESIEK